MLPMSTTATSTRAAAQACCCACGSGCSEYAKITIGIEAIAWLGSVLTVVPTKIDVVKSRLVKDYAYCDVCATDVLNYVASIFARGDAKR